MPQDTLEERLARAMQEEKPAEKPAGGGGDSLEQRLGRAMETAPSFVPTDLPGFPRGPDIPPMLPEKAPESVGEAAQRAGWAGVEGGATELGGRMLLKPLEWTIGRYLDPEGLYQSG